MPGPRIGGLDIGAGMIDQMHVMHAGGTGGHAGQAREAAVDMLDHVGRRRPLVLQHILHQVNAATGTIELITEQHVEAAAAPSVLGLLGHDLVGEVAHAKPGERILDAAFEQFDHRADDRVRDEEVQPDRAEVQGVRRRAA